MSKYCVTLQGAICAVILSAAKNPRIEDDTTSLEGFFAALRMTAEGFHEA